MAFFKPRHKLLALLLTAALAQGMILPAVYAADEDTSASSVLEEGASVSGGVSEEGGGASGSDGSSEMGEGTPAPDESSDVDGDAQYNVQDIAVINSMLSNNWPEGTRPELAPEDGSSVPDSWTFATWSDSADGKRITTLNLAERGLTGDLNVSGLTTLEILDCSLNKSLTSLDASGCTSLTKLDCNNYNSAEGLGQPHGSLKVLHISDCISLEELVCKYNEITALDASQSTALELLDCSENELTTLKISAPTKLRELSCWSNKLSELNVSQYTVLEVLDCGLNQFTSLDVSTLTSLKRFACDNNPLLTAVDVSGNTTLERLDCYFNEKMTSVTASGCTALTDLNCGMYSSGGGFYKRGSLTHLDVSGCNALKWFTCAGQQLTSLDVINSPELEQILCEDNQLTSLNLAGCHKLNRIECSQNKLTSLDLSHFPELRELGCSENQLTSLDVSHCPQLMYLNCTYNMLPDKSAVIGFTGVWGPEGDRFQFDPQRAGSDSPATPPPTSPSVPNDNNNYYDSSDDKEQNSASSSTPTTAAPSIVTAAEASAAVSAALKESAKMATGVHTFTARLRNRSNISLETMQAMVRQAKTASLNTENRTKLIIYADSVKKQSVDVRISFNPELATKEINLSGSTVNDDAKAVTSHFEKYYTNKVMTVALGQKDNFGMPVKIAAKRIPEVNTSNLFFYSYNKATNKYKRIVYPQYWIDKNSYIHFTTESANYIIISDGPLEER